MTCKILTHSLIGFAVLSLASLSTHAATVIWDTPKTILNNSDVLNTGTFVSALNYTGATTTINGVTFTQNITGTGGNTTITGSGLGNFNGAGSGAAPYSNLSAEYKALLSTLFYTNVNSPFTFTLNSLTSGQAYRIQIWTNISGADTRAMTVTGGANTSGTVDSNVTNLNGGVGQYVVGTFTANSTSQVLTINTAVSGQSPLVNGYSLYAIPEPTTALLMAFGLMTTLFFRRRRLN